MKIASNRDTTLVEDPTGSLGNGAGEHMFVGRTGQSANSVRRGVIAFDIAGSIPPGATIGSVSLTLHMSQTSAGLQTVKLHQALADWGEGSSDSPGGIGAPASDGDATWLHRRLDGQKWTAPGGDFSGDIAAATSVGDAAFYSWSSPEMARDVQGWLDNPESDFGWLLVGNEAQSRTSKRFDSKKNGIEGNRPVLNVQFTPAAPETGGKGLSGEALTALAILGLALVFGGGLMLAALIWRPRGSGG